ncbi:MAG: 50S ribosomal protein L18e [Candidatus Heimdallarchaeota archaeon]
MPKLIRLTDPNHIALVKILKKSKAPIYRDIAKRIQTPRRKRSAINVSKLARYTKPDDTVIVPGKVLAPGQLDHQLTVAALSFSTQARKRIEAAGGLCLTIAELVEKNSSGNGVKILV